MKTASMDYNSLQIQEFYKRFEAISGFLDQILQRTTAGELPPLGSLDHDIDALCKEVQNAAPEISREMQPAMADIIAKLDELAQGLHTYKQDLTTDEKD